MTATDFFINKYGGKEPSQMDKEGSYFTNTEMCRFAEEYAAQFRTPTPQSEGDGMIHLTKEEHRQQIIDAVDYCWECNDKKGYVPDGETYYNQTFPNQIKNII